MSGDKVISHTMFRLMSLNNRDPGCIMFPHSYLIHIIVHGTQVCRRVGVRAKYSGPHDKDPVQMGDEIPRENARSQRMSMFL